MGKEQDDFTWIVPAWEELNAKRNVRADYRQQQINEVEYGSWRKHKKSDYSATIIYLVLFVFSIVIALLLH